MPNEQYSIALNLQRWDRTILSLNWKERLTTFFTGRITLDDPVGYNCLGWVPVFPDKGSADQYVATEASSAQIFQVARSLEE